MKHKVAAIQLHPLRMNMADNYARAASHIRTTAQQGCSLAVLPEYCLTGWVPKDPRFGEVAEDRSYLIKFQELAKECNINIVPGTMVEKHIDEGKEMLYNVAYFIDNKGVILGRYIKKNLWHPEREHLEAGGDNEHRAIETPLGKVGLLICWDLACKFYSLSVNDCEWQLMGVGSSRGVSRIDYSGR
jgi:predicted amidohydrolase